MSRLDQIEARANAATPGPWEAGCNDRHVLYVTTENEEFCAEYGPELYDSQGFFSDADTEFIAHARTDMPDMAAALRAVLEIHQDGGESQGYLDDGSYGDMPHCCTECWSLGEYGVPYPCPTVTAIRQHLGDDL